MKINIPLLCLLTCLLGACATPFKRGIKSMERAEYQTAISYFKEDLTTNKGSKALTNAQIGEAYRLSGRLSESEIYYKTALDNNSSDNNVRFYYALALKSNGKYKEAEERFISYAKNGTNTDLVKRAKSEVENFKKIYELLEKKTYFEVTNLDKINSQAGEFAPVIFQDQLLISSTRKPDVYENIGSNFSGIYALKLAEMDSNPSITLFSDKINLEASNEASPAFSHDGSFVI